MVQAWWGTTGRDLLSGTAAAALLLAPALADAQTAPVALEPIVVEGSGDGATDPVEGYVAGRTATGSKTATPVEEIPQAVSVIGREQIENLGAEKADEALRYTAGVFAQPFGPDTDTNWLFIRGFQATQTGLYLDGLQSYGFGFGGFLIDSYLLDRVEVLKGAASVLYGGSNPGGLVNLVSRRPVFERLRALDFGINDAGTGYVGFDVGDAVDAETAYRVTGRVLGGQGYSDEQDEFRGTVSPAVTMNLGEDTTLTVLANLTVMDQNHGGGSFLPYVGTVVPAPFGFIDRDTNFTEPAVDTYERKQGHIGYDLEHRLENGWEIRQNARYGHSDLREVSIYPYGYNAFSPTPTDPSGLLSRINFEHDTVVDTVLVDTQIEGEVRTGPVDHQLLMGIDYKFFRMDQMQATGAVTPISAVDPVYGGVVGPRTPYIDEVISQHQIGLYAQDQMRFGDGWIVTLNGRYDYVSTDVDGLRTGGDDTGEWSGRAGLAYAFDNGITPYASVSTFFNPQIGSSPVAGFYKPETGHQVEVGVKVKPEWFDGLFQVALFDLTRKNVVTGPFLAETQIGEFNSRGIEVEAQANITENLLLTAAFTAFDLEITEDANATLIGNTPFIVPETQASLSFHYTFGTGLLEGFTVGGGVRYQGSSWVDNENTLKVPSATVFDAKVGFDAEDWSVALNVNNIFDRDYVASCQTQFACSYGEGRVAKLTAQIRF
ncbi:TonB-dependent siderophore receptor [Chthonobacter rhizosphaerae]|uniref:TonB-dependent siderophore receptor n=1 Tax=Chthonobacter rhizosphaerae TaxID=2735553 RepID=UPI0015EF92DB|nr:TonB-dependent siderophore receptor [Chthonobacter rhizosphaerae]